MTIGGGEDLAQSNESVGTLVFITPDSANAKDDHSLLT